MKLGKKSDGKGKQRNKITKTATRPKTGTTSLESVFLTIFISLTLLVSTGSALVYMTLKSNMINSQNTSNQLLVESYARQIEQSMHHYIEAMDLMVKEPGLIQALRTNNEDALHKRESLLAYIFPAALRIKILPPEFDEPDNSINPPISYACLDLLHKSRMGDSSIVEIHLLGKPEQHIDIARNIKGNDSKTLGNLLVTLPVQAVKQVVKQMKTSTGLLELLQTNSRGQSITIISRGNNEFKSGEPLIMIPIKNTLLKIAYWPNDGIVGLDNNSTMMFWAIVAAVWIVLSLILYLMYKRLYKALLNDQVMIIKLVKDIQVGEMSNRYPISLKNCLGAMEQLRMIAGNMTGLREKNKNTDSPKSALAEAAEVSQLSELSLTPSTDALEVRDLTSKKATLPESSLDTSIFKAYDIRGIVNKTLTTAIAQKIGHALGSEAHYRDQQKIVVARDGRLSGPELSKALIDGLIQSGIEVVDIGRVPTPVLYFASHYIGNGSGVMLTGSHNPPEYNGMKMMLNGDTLHGEAITSLKERIDTDNLISGTGSLQTIDVVPSYIERIISDVRLERPLKIVVDCGNGVAGEIAPQLYRALGCEVVDMFCEVDGNFPNHHPDPSKPENLMPLARAVTEHKADLGLAFDGDGDRLGVIDSSGKIIWPDRYLMLLAMDVLTRQPGAQIIYDVKCTSHLEKIISDHGGQPLMWKTGHSFIKAKMKETGAQLAGEMSGHIFFKERWLGFDDALYAGARLLEILASESENSHQVFSTLPESVSTPELNVKMQEGENHVFMQKLKASAHFPGAKMIDIDGLRLEFEDGWALVRASNTTPSLVIRFEANDAATMGRIQDMLRSQLTGIKPDLDLPF
jgi:phosphomannomutase/phosphoglucomutase